MIDRERILNRLTPLTPAEASRLIHEMGDVVNSISVQLRDAGYDLGLVADSGLASELMRAWHALYNARPMVAALAKQHPVAVDAPLWIGDEPPLDRGPSPV